MNNSLMLKRAFALLLAAVLIIGGFGCSVTSGSDLKGSVFNVAGNEPYSLDPAVAADANSNVYISQIFSGLVRLDRDLMPSPDIAKSWQVSEDGLIYTFLMRQDVHFHSGRQVTAEDFVYSWNRAADPDTGSTTAGTYLGDIVGVSEVLAGEADTISGVRAIDNFTLEVAIDQPRSYFLMKMAFVTSYVVDNQEVGLSSDWWRQPNGTGPFKLYRFGDDGIVLEKNEDYYLGAPLVDYVSFVFHSGRPIDLYEVGEVDICPVNTSYIDRVRDQDGSYYQDLIVYPEMNFFYVAFNTEEPPFDDSDIRRAFAMALDIKRLISLVYLDTVEPSEGILPPGMPGHNANIEGIPFDVAAAKELIAQSSYGSVENLPPITLTAGGYGGLIAQEIEAMVYQWRENLGVEVTVRQIDPDTYSYELKEERDNLFYYGWIADYPHPQNFLEVLFGSGSEANSGGYSNSQVDFLLLAAAVATDSSQSLSLYQQAEQLLIDDTACIPFWFGENYVLVKPYVGDYYQNALGMPVLTEVVVLPHEE